MAQSIAWKHTTIALSAGLDSKAASFECSQKLYLPCSWLGRPENVNSYPHYLCNLELKKMATASTLDQKPKYTCIGHTWGRWRIGSSIAMFGMPWMVPQSLWCGATARSTAPSATPFCHWICLDRSVLHSARRPAHRNACNYSLQDCSTGLDIQQVTHLHCVAKTASCMLA